MLMPPRMISSLSRPVMKKKGRPGVRGRIPRLRSGTTRGRIFSFASGAEVSPHHVVAADHDLAPFPLGQGVPEASWIAISLTGSGTPIDGKPYAQPVLVSAAGRSRGRKHE